MPFFHARRIHPRQRKRLLQLACLATLATAGFAQQPTAVAVPQQAATVAAPQAALPSPTAISLDDAIARARSNEPVFAAAAAASRNAALDRSIARSALLPSVQYHNQYLYTQPVVGPSWSWRGIPGDQLQSAVYRQQCSA